MLHYNTRSELRTTSVEAMSYVSERGWQEKHDIAPRTQVATCYEKGRATSQTRYANRQAACPAVPEDARSSAAGPHLRILAAPKLRYAVLACGSHCNTGGNNPFQNDAVIPQYSDNRRKLFLINPAEVCRLCLHRY